MCAGSIAAAICQPGVGPPLLYNLVMLLGDAGHPNDDIRTFEAACQAMCAIAGTPRGCAAMASAVTLTHACRQLLPVLVQHASTGADAAEAQSVAVLSLVAAVTRHAQGRVAMLQAFQGAHTCDAVLLTGLASFVLHCSAPDTSMSLDDM